MKVQLTSKKEVFNFCKPYIIAELGANHNGDMELAKKLIVQAKEAGADCVKFQSWTKDSVFARKKYEDNYFIADDYRDRTDYTLEEIVDAYSISEDELLEMKKFADEIGIDCTSTPFSKKETDFLVDKLESPFIKVASMDLNNYPFLEYLAKKNKPIVISTGLSELYEIDKAVKTIEKPTHSFFVSAGIYMLSTDVLKYIPKNDFYDMPTLFEKLISENKNTISFPLREYWLDIGRMEEYKKANDEYDEVF
jgi:N-acetylneuraminate synthase